MEVLAGRCWNTGRLGAFYNSVATCLQPRYLARGEVATMAKWWKRMLAKLPGAQDWRPDPFGERMRMRRRGPDGEIEYREPTTQEFEDALEWQAHR